MTWASATVGALVASSLTIAAAPATAAVAAPAPVLKWEISQRFDEHLSTHTWGGGATEDESGVVTFPDGATTIDAGTGAASTAYAGSVRGAFVAGVTEYYAVTIASPTVTVKPDGSGSVSALVSASNAAAMGNPAASTSPARVVVTTFGTSGTWTETQGLRTLTVAPAWDNVLPPNSSQSTAQGIPADQPVGGKSFAPSFLGQLTSGVRAHFYASSEDSDIKKPATLVAQTAPATTATITSQSAAGGVRVTVKGVGFTAGTNEGDDGVYAGIAPSGGLPDVDDREQGMAAFAHVDWVTGSQIVGGAFSRTLVVPTAKLNPSKTYSVYTWRAHGHSDTSQDTETPLAIDFAKLRPAASITLTGPARVGYATTPAYVLRVAGTGTVRLTGAGAAQTAKITGGTARFVLPKGLAAGAKVLTFVYSGDGTYAPTTMTRRLVVAKGGTAVSSTLARRATTKQAGILRVGVRAARAGSPVPVGRVQVTMTKGKKRRVAYSNVLKAGRVNLVLPKVGKGIWKVSLKYTGSGNYATSVASRSLSVTKK